MSNSSLVNCTVLSPNHSGQRTRKIDTITPHCVVGQLSAESIGGCFPAGRDASCNYGIGFDGRVCLIVDERYRSWCSSNPDNDHRAITIECASDKTDPYAMNNAVYSKLIKLCVDICRRNGISVLLWLGGKAATLAYKPKSNEAVLTAHRWFANKSCPGDWLYARYGDLANQVTAQLGGSVPDPAPQPPTGDALYRVQVGAYKEKANAVVTENKLKAAGFDTYLISAGGLYKVQTGAFKQKANADALVTKLKAKGFETFITTNGGTSSGSRPATIAEGDRVRVNRGAESYTGQGVAAFVYDKTYTVDELRGARAVLDRNGICTAFNVKDLTKA